MRNICYSGGARGADSVFSKCAYDASHDVFHMSFLEHRHEAKFGMYNILFDTQLMEADPFLKQANKVLDRSIPTNLYTLNLLRRNYYQIKDVERVYAVTPIDVWGKVIGGTAWAVQMAIDIRIPEIYVYDLYNNHWTRSLGQLEFGGCWEDFMYNTQPPRPHGSYAGIGSREISAEGRKAITSLYR